MTTTEPTIPVYLTREQAERVFKALTRPAVHREMEDLNIANTLAWTMDAHHQYLDILTRCNLRLWLERKEAGI